jgi:RNA polymerase sigma factor (sigma-70 family)
MVGDHGRAEDIAQEVFISALRRLRETDRAIVFKPWIYEIARNACIDEFRRKRRTREVPLEGDGSGIELGPVLISSAPTPDAAIESKQRLDHLRGAFGGLSESHHRILVLRELEGLSYTEIGQQLGMSRPVVESTLFRARRRLGEEYDELRTGRRCQRVQDAIAAGESRPLESFGIRERRLLARHLAHCQPCRRMARQAGVDESLFHSPTLIGKLAALLPIPWLRLRRSRGGDDAVAAAGSHQATAIQSLQTIVQVADPTGPVFGLGRAAAAAAAMVIAGAGGGIVTGLVDPGKQGPPRARTKAGVSGPGAAQVLTASSKRASKSLPLAQQQAASAALNGGHGPARTGASTSASGTPPLIAPAHHVTSSGSGGAGGHPLQLPVGAGSTQSGGLGLQSGAPTGNSGTSQSPVSGAGATLAGTLPSTGSVTSNIPNVQSVASVPPPPTPTTSLPPAPPAPQVTVNASVPSAPDVSLPQVRVAISLGH